ncbi:HdeD family acid-resistance protein [Candidatus Odyssella thessalonicensis]|uniref:HdeD family acid-resistance protein n=1 Tax=Candidatus Odyssella thessalonicensis TaxID=84647 RepID=UPI000225C089|nr:HdeD family acid-resistance protein [Candidatus Odyssella thessalonicensis]
MRKHLQNTSHYNNISYMNSASSLEANWWAFAIRGLLSLIFGSLAICMPVTTVVAMTIIFGAYSIVDGAVSLISGINRLTKDKRWGALVLNGVIGILFGLTVLIMPQLASLSIAVFFGAMTAIWSIATGLGQINAGLRLRREIPHEGLLALNGTVSTILGILILVLVWVKPLISLITLGWLIGANFIASGIILSLLAFKLHNLTNNLLHPRESFADHS